MGRTPTTSREKPHQAANMVYGCGQSVRSGGVNALSRKQGP